MASSWAADEMGDMFPMRAAVAHFNVPAWRMMCSKEIESHIIWAAHAVYPLRFGLLRTNCVEWNESNRAAHQFKCEWNRTEISNSDTGPLNTGNGDCLLEFDQCPIQMWMDGIGSSRTRVFELFARLSHAYLVRYNRIKWINCSIRMFLSNKRCSSSQQQTTLEKQRIVIAFVCWARSHSYMCTIVPVYSLQLCVWLILNAFTNRQPVLLWKISIFASDN